MMLCTDQNVINYLCGEDYTEAEAKTTLARYYDIFLEGVEKDMDAIECGQMIISKHMVDVDTENGVRI